MFNPVPLRRDGQGSRCGSRPVPRAGGAGWIVLAHLTLKDTSLPDDFFLPYLETIERDIHQPENGVRDAMIRALVAIGIRGGDLEEKALATAGRIGKVEVDHGDTA